MSAVDSRVGRFLDFVQGHPFGTTPVVNDSARGGCRGRWSLS